MTTATTHHQSRLEELTSQLAEHLDVAGDMVVIYSDVTDTIVELIKIQDQPGARFVTAGAATPDLLLAGHKAGIRTEEILGASPFAADLQTILDNVRPRDIVYLANPHRLTGTQYTLTQLEQIAESLTSGMLIVDEYYLDYTGITAFPLLERNPNVVILRSFGALHHDTTEAGYLLSNSELIRWLQPEFSGHIPVSIQRLVSSLFIAHDASLTRQAIIQKEALRIVSSLTKLGIQFRLTPADFLLLRVASPELVCNSLAREHILIQNLDGYPQLENYLRFEICNPETNGLLISAFEHMPAESYKLTSIDRRALVFTQAGVETTSTIFTSATHKGTSTKTRTF